MKATKAILFSFLFVLAAGSVSAQRAERGDTDHTERLTKALDLEFAQSMEGKREALKAERKDRKHDRRHGRRGEDKG